MESLKDFNEPRLVALLDEKGNDGQNLIAVMELYADRTTTEASTPRNHVLITIYEKSGLPYYIEQTTKKNRLLHIRNGVSPETVASLQLAGTESEETLKKNVARFNKKVKEFREKNKINYQDRSTDSVSNRSLLANAFEGVVKDDTERKKIREYRENIDGLNEQEEKLRELQDEAIKTANRIDVYDKRLLYQHFFVMGHAQISSTFLRNASEI